MDPVARTRVRMAAAPTKIVRQRTIIAPTEPVIGAAASDRATPDGAGRVAPATETAADPGAEAARGRATPVAGPPAATAADGPAMVEVAIADGRNGPRGATATTP